MTSPILQPSPSPASHPQPDASQGARESRALAEIIQEINQSLEVERVFALIARHAAELLGAPGASVGLVENGEVLCVAGAGAAPAGTGTRSSIDDACCAETLRSARPSRCRLAGADGAPRSALSVPMVVAHRAVGAVTVVGDPAREFDEHDERILVALGNHAALAIENGRLLRASVRTLRHASILATSARSLALNVSPQAMYADIWRIAHQSLGADGISIYFADTGTHDVDLVFTGGIGADFVEEVMPQFWETAAARALSTGLPDFRSDLRELGDRPVARFLVERGVNAIALLPLTVEGRPRGMLTVRYRDVQAFEPEQRQLLTDFSSHAAVALRNALLLERTEQRAARLAAVAKVQHAISAALSLPEVYAEIYRAVASVVDAPSFSLMRFDEASREFIPDYVVNDGEPVPCDALPRFPLGEGFTSQAYRLRAPNVVSRGAAGWDAAAVEIGDTQTPAVILSAPIVHGERVLGVLQAQSYRRDAYVWGDVDLVMLIASQAGTAIANALLFETERLERQEAEAAAAIARIAPSAADVGSAASEFLRLLETIVPTAASAIAVEHADDARLHIAAASGAASALAGTSRANAAAFSVPAEWDAVFPLAAGEHEEGVLALRGVPAQAAARLGAIARLVPSLTLALRAIRMREEERRLSEQVRQHEKLAALGELVAGVAHEVNNPLAGISAFAQLLQEEHLTPEQHEAVQMIKREADRAVAVIRDLLTFARKSGPRAVPIDLNALLEQTLRLRQYGLRTAGVAVRLDTEPALHALHGDDRQLQQVLLNLIVNAEHAMAASPRRELRLRTANEGTRVVLEVSDTGAGMSPELQARIFEPFFTTKGEGKGTGLGLSVSYGIVQAHGGTITVTSTPGAGATFRLSLPAARAAGPSRAA